MFLLKKAYYENNHLPHQEETKSNRHRLIENCRAVNRPVFCPYRHYPANRVSAMTLRLIAVLRADLAVKKRIELPLNYDSEKVRKIILSRHITDAVYFKMNGKIFGIKNTNT